MFSLFFLGLSWFCKVSKGKKLPWERLGVPNPGGRRAEDGEGGGEQKRLFFG